MNNPEPEMNDTTSATCARRHSRVRPDERARILEEFQQSALTLADFAAERGINYSTLVGWRQAQRREAGHALCTDMSPGAQAVRGSKTPLLETAKVMPQSDDAKTNLRFTEVCLQDEPQALGLARREAKPMLTPAPAPLEVTLRGGAVVRGADMAQLAELLRILGN